MFGVIIYMLYIYITIKTNKAMKTTRFATTTEDLKLIIEDTKDLNFKMEVENRPNQRDILVTVTALETDLFEFIDRNELQNACSEIIEND